MTATAAAALDVDSLIDRLLHVGEDGSRLTTTISAGELSALCEKITVVLRKESTLIEVDVPATIVGDVHGQFSDLLRVFRKKGFPHSVSYVFLGDYVDRGRQSLETAALLFCYKLKFPKTFFLLRGNHETQLINGAYGFRSECDRRYPGSSLWLDFNRAFSWLPYCALVGKRILGMHGGLSPELHSLDQLRHLRRGVDPENPSLELDLLWADPDPDKAGWNVNPRGASFVFGQDVAYTVCAQLDVDLVVRAHQVVQDGYEFFANRRVVTVFSAPHYTAQFNNDAATMSVDEDLSCSFDQFHPR